MAEPGGETNETLKNPHETDSKNSPDRKNPNALSEKLFSKFQKKKNDIYEATGRSLLAFKNLVVWNQILSKVPDYGKVLEALQQKESHLELVYEGQPLAIDINGNFQIESLRFVYQNNTIFFRNPLDPGKLSQVFENAEKIPSAMDEFFGKNFYKNFTFLADDTCRFSFNFNRNRSNKKDSGDSVNRAQNRSTHNNGAETYIIFSAPNIPAFIVRYEQGFSVKEELQLKENVQLFEKKLKQQLDEIRKAGKTMLTFQDISAFMPSALLPEELRKTAEQYYAALFALKGSVKPDEKRIFNSLDHDTVIEEETRNDQDFTLKYFPVKTPEEIHVENQVRLLQTEIFQIHEELKKSGKNFVTLEDIANFIPLHFLPEELREPVKKYYDILPKYQALVKKRKEPLYFDFLNNFQSGQQPEIPNIFLGINEQVTEELEEKRKPREVKFKDGKVVEFSRNEFNPVQYTDKHGNKSMLVQASIHGRVSYLNDGRAFLVQENAFLPEIHSKNIVIIEKHEVYLDKNGNKIQEKRYKPGNKLFETVTFFPDGNEEITTFDLHGKPVVSEKIIKGKDKEPKQRKLYFYGKGGVAVSDYFTEKEKEWNLSIDEYASMLAHAIDTPEKWHRFLTNYLDYTFDTPDPSKPLLIGTPQESMEEYLKKPASMATRQRQPENRSEYFQTYAETIVRVNKDAGKVKGDCDDTAFLVQEMLRLQGIKSYVIFITDHAFCAYLQKRTDGKYDAFAFDTGGFIKNGQRFQENGDMNNKGFATPEEAMASLYDFFKEKDPLYRRSDGKVISLPSQKVQKYGENGFEFRYDFTDVNDMINVF